MTAGWHEVADLDGLHEGKGKLVRAAGRTLALFRVGDAVYAVDNQCPHEGYPLAEGSVRDGILTCNWHNWRFRLDGGACVFGGEDVRSYPVEVREGTVFVNVEEPPPAVAVPGRKTSLKDAIEDLDTGRMARDVLRLLKMGVEPAEILLDAAVHGAERAEYGWNHALAVVTDCARIARGRTGLDRVLPVTQACRAVSEETLRLPPRPHPGPAPVESFADAPAMFRALRDAVETGRLDDAESLFRGAVAAGVGSPELERWLYTLATDHFLAYGHALIYATKAFEMRDLLGKTAVERVFPCLIPELHHATREDLLPYMRSLTRSLAGITGDLPALVEKQQAGGDREWDATRFRRTLLDGTARETFDATHELLDRGVPVDRILDAAVLAAAERILRFDPARDRMRDKDFSWLDVTHNLTYANAARKAFRAVPTAEVLRGVYFATWFVNRTRKLDLPEEARSAPPPEGDPPSPPAEGLREAIDDHDLRAAAAAAASLARTGPGTSVLADLLVGMSLEDRAAVQIYVDHLIKTAVAAAEESSRLRDRRDGALPLVATARFFAADRRERGVERQVRLAIEFVEHGRPSETV